MSVALERYMYDKGYGPTNPLLGNYLRKFFLGQEPEADDGQRVRDLAVQHRADTLFGELLAKNTEPVPGKPPPPR
jgi:hypothetical protein